MLVVVYSERPDQNTECLDDVRDSVGRDEEPESVVCGDSKVAVAAV